LGLLIEEQRTNLVTYSEQFDNAAWTKSASATITPNQIVSPNGSINGDLLTANQDNGVFQTVTVTNGAAITNSCYVKGGTAATIMLRDDSGAGRHIVVSTSTWTITSTSGTLLGSGVTAVGNGWYRLFISYTTDSTTARGFIRPDSSGTGQNFYIWGAQIEAGAFPTSYVATVASQVTRSADAASMTGANFSSWFSNAEGTLYAEFNPLALAASSGVVINDNTTSNRIRLATTSVSDQGTVTTSGTAQAVLDGGTPAANTSMKLAMTYQVNNFALSLNGATAATDTTGIVPVVSQLQIGSETTTVGNLRIKKMAYYPIVSTAIQLQALTS
jgi:hypothetical protein